MSQIRNFGGMGDDEGEPLRLDQNTRLALDRTFLAHERTLMAWIRTSASLISFGFTINKFFEYFYESSLVTPVHALLGPRHFGMGMILVGVVTLAVVTFEHHREIKAFQVEYGVARKSLVGKVAAVVSLLGLGLFLVVWFNL